MASHDGGGVEVGLAFLDRLPALEELTLLGGNPETLARLPILAGLRRLTFVAPQGMLRAPDLGLDRQPQLRALRFHGVVELAGLRGLDLDALELRHVTPEALRSVGIPTSVRRLTMSVAAVRGLGSTELAAALPGVEQLTLLGNGDTLDPIAFAGLPRLRTLRLTRLERRSLARFAVLPDIFVSSIPDGEETLDPCFDWRESGWPTS